MELSQFGIARLYIFALILGAFLGLLYDLFRITRVFLGMHYSRRAAKRLESIRLPLLDPRKKRKESRALGVVIFLEDLLFCLMAAVSLILLFYGGNNGKFRVFALFCTAGGFLLYRVTLGRAVMLFSEVIAFALETFARYAVFFLLFPLRWSGGLVCRLAKRMTKRILRARRYKSRQRFTKTETQRILRDGCGLIPKAPPEERTIKRGKYIGKRKEKTIQPVADDAHTSGRVGGGIHRGIRG